MKTTSLFTILLSAFTLNSVYAQQKIAPAVEAAMKVASADQLKADITYLADDKLLGRKPGTPGYQMAVDYVVSQLKKYNVKPAGDNGTWVQNVMMRSAVVKPGAMVSFVSPAKTIEAKGADLMITPNPVVAKTNIDAEVVFVGYGISSPKNNYDSYKGADVKGKVVIFLRGIPESYPQGDAVEAQAMATVQKNALAKGAIGVLMGTVMPPRTPPAGQAAGPAFVARPTNTVMTPKGEIVINANFTDARLQMAGTVGFQAMTDILAAAGKDLKTVVESLKKGEQQSFNTSFRLKANFETSHNEFMTYNVAGKIEGSDPKLKNEYVVHSAHLDHTGISRPVEGDSINNGAHDNASGVASLLQIANIYSKLNAKPKRSILVVFVTAEEMGLLGSSYFAQRPTVPISSIVANVNTDMPAIIAPLLSVTALGADHSTLTKQVNEAAAHMNMTVEPDPEPNENRFVRSDQYSFIKEGIPALHIKYGNKTADGKNNLAEFVQKWRAKYYHKPQDDINGIFDFDAGKNYAQLNFLIGYLVANDPVRPTWNPGDIFEKKK